MMNQKVDRNRRFKKVALQIRRDVLRMTNRSGGSHIGTSFSIVEILTALYVEILAVDPERPDWPDRDRFILSKGHGCAALYATLANRGFFPRQWLETFYQNGSPLVGHATHKGIPGVEVSTGSLGHGLSIGCGMAISAKRDDHQYRIITLLSDGECDEGSVWEAALFAAHHRLDNLVVIVDYNKIQSLGRVDEVLGLEPLADKWTAFGWSVNEIDGHDFGNIIDAMANLPIEQGKPTCIIAHTTKGRGVSFMEDRLLWHYRSPNSEEFERALLEIEATQ